MTGQCGQPGGYLAHLRQLAELEQPAAVHEIIRKARQISPSPSMHVYVADLERALGVDAPVPHKLGGNDGSEP